MCGFNLSYPIFFVVGNFATGRITRGNYNSGTAYYLHVATSIIRSNALSCKLIIASPPTLLSAEGNFDIF